MGSPLPPSIVRRLMGKIAHPTPTPTPIPSLGDQKFSAPQLVSSLCGGRDTGVPGKARVSPVVRAQQEECVDFLLIQQADKECGPPRTSWEILCHQGLHVLLYMQARMDCRLPSFFKDLLAYTQKLTQRIEI